MDNPAPEVAKKSKPTDYLSTEVKALNMILTGLRLLAAHRRPVVMKYINELFESTGVQIKS